MAESRKMKNFDNSLRIYNRRVMLRTRMHTYTKKYIDNLMHKAFYLKCFVRLDKLTDEDVENYKQSLKDKGNISKEGNTSKDDIISIDDNTSKDDQISKDGNASQDYNTAKDDNASKDDNTSINDEPAKKKQKVDTNEVDFLKMVLSREGETDKFKSQFKSSLKTNSKIASATTEEVPMDIDYEESTTSVNSSAISAKPRISVIDAKLMIEKDRYESYVEMFITQYLNRLNSVKRSAIQAKLSTSGSKPSTSGSKPSTSGSKPSTSGSKPSTSGSKPSTSGSKPSTSGSKPSTSGSKPSTSGSKPSTSGSKPSTSGSKPSTSGPKSSLNSTKVNGVKNPLNIKIHTKGNLLEIEKLYKKYFSKSIQDTIVIIANILNIISMSNKHHKARMDESFKKRSEAEKLKERCDANRLHARHKKILESKLKNNFSDVVSSFSESEFESAFQMFFLSILTVLRVLDQPKFRKGSIFKNLVLLLWNSLKNSDYNHPRIFSMFRSKTFRPDCIDLISLIEDSRDSDPGVTDRMTLFFVSTVNSREYFQAVIDAVTSDSNEDLAILIDNATFQCCVNSKFKDPIDTPDVQHSNNTSVTETTQSPINADENAHRWFIAKPLNGSFQHIPVINANKPQTIGNTAVEPPIVTGQPINNFYESFSSSLQKKTSESSTPKVIAAKKCFVVAPTISNSPLKVTAAPSVTATSTLTPTTTFVTFKPPFMNGKSLVANSPLQKADGSTFMVGTRQFQLVKGTPGHVRAVVNGANIVLKSPPSNIVKCYAKNCNNPATIMCSSCTTVKYCSHQCQRQDWYVSHIQDCERLLNIRQTRP